ncbi:hypothetical protein [Photorhabdus heterorhabditis]|nr:hypothetical protein [Photorhabdus heterorhabditis]
MMVSQHFHLPTRFQNWQLKGIDNNNARFSTKVGNPMIFLSIAA